jgi:hypothetical protein
MKWRNLAVAVVVVGLACWYAPGARAASGTLKSASITFTTPSHSDNKNKETRVTVEVLAQAGSDDPVTIAEKKGFAGDQEFEDPSEHTFDIPVTNKISTERMDRLFTKVNIAPRGNDRWIFHWTLVLVFEGKDGEFRMVRRATGIILDQQFNTRTTTHWVRVPKEDLSEMTLKSAQITFTTPNRSDDKDASTEVAVRINRRGLKLNEQVAHQTGIGKGVQFPDSSSKGPFPLEIDSKITLAEYMTAEHEIAISTARNDRWIFDYRLELMFEGGGRSKTYFEEGKGVILDQDFRTLTVR